MKVFFPFQVKQVAKEKRDLEEKVKKEKATISELETTLRYA